MDWGQDSRLMVYSMTYDVGARGLSWPREDGGSVMPWQPYWRVECDAVVVCSPPPMHQPPMARFLGCECSVFKASGLLLYLRCLRRPAG